METNQAPTSTSANGSTKRRERLPSPHAPGEAYGEAVKELFSLAGVARMFADFGASEEPIVAAEVAEHLAMRLAALASTLADQAIRYAPNRGD